MPPSRLAPLSHSEWQSALAELERELNQASAGAHAFSQRLLRAARQQHQGEYELHIRLQLTYNAWSQLDYRRMRRCAQTLIATARTEQAHNFVLDGLRLEGQALALLNRPHAALQSWLAGLNLAHRLQQYGALCETLLNISNLLLAARGAEHALPVIELCCELASEHRLARQQFQGGLYLCNLLVNQPEPRSPQPWLQRLHTLDRSTADPAWECDLILIEARHALNQHALDDAQRHCEHAQRLAHELGYTWGLRIAHFLKADLACARDEARTAARHLLRAQRHCDEQLLPLARQRQLARCFEQAGLPARALKAYEHWHQQRCTPPPGNNLSLARRSLAHFALQLEVLILRIRNQRLMQLLDQSRS